MTEPKFDLNVVLSLFDGISCGQEALKKAGISTRIFLASEIEKYPKMVTRKNHPLTVQLGDVTKVVADDLPHVNLLMGGSPCQGFSFAGKQLNFDDPRSALFFEFVRLLKECKPDYFLLENVMMKQEYQNIITEHLGVEPVMINSALVSAQNRKRLYWTNIPGVSLPDDEGILLKDVLEDGIASDEMTTKGKSYCLTARYSGAVAWNSIEKKQRTMVKSVTIRAASGGGHIPSVTLKQPQDKGILLKDVLENGVADIVTNQGKTTHKENIDKAACLLARDYKGFGNQGMTGVRVGGHRELKVFISPESAQKYAPSGAEFVDPYNKKEIKGDKSTTLRTNSSNGNMWVREPICGRIVGRKINPETGKRDDYNLDLKAEQRLEPRLDEKTGTLTTVQKDNVVVDGPTYRKLTPIECERLQTLPDNYTEGVSNTQRYKALGNGWTVDVIVHILQGLKQQVKAVAA